MCDLRVDSYCGYARWLMVYVKTLPLFDVVAYGSSSVWQLCCLIPCGNEWMLFLGGWPRLQILAVFCEMNGWLILDEEYTFTGI